MANVGEEVEKLEPSYMTTRNDVAALENSLAVSQMLRLDT